MATALGEIGHREDACMNRKGGKHEKTKGKMEGLTLPLGLRKRHNLQPFRVHYDENDDDDDDKTQKGKMTLFDTESCEGRNLLRIFLPFMSGV